MDKNLKLRQITKADDTALETISSWFDGWWDKHIWRKDNIKKYISYMTQENRIPMLFVLEDNGVPVATASIDTSDEVLRPDLYPFLVNVFVEKSHRGKGYSLMIVNYALEKAKQIGIEQLYLRTQHTGLYEKCGFEYMGQCELFDGSFERLYNIKF